MIEATSATQQSTSDQSRVFAIQLNELLGDKDHATISVAESCTGGNVAHRITSVPGSSTYFLGGVVSYANSAKTTLLGVSTELLDRYGAVSAECAAAMASGARSAFRSDIAVSTTGIAGPEGGASTKPVGLVYFGLATDTETQTEHRQFSGSRAEIIEAASAFALDLLVQASETTIVKR